VARSKIVDGDADPEEADGLHSTQSQLEISHDRGFRDLDAHRVRIETISFQCRLDIPHDLVALELPSRNIDAHFEIVTLAMPPSNAPDRLFEHPSSDSDNQTRLFKVWDELAWADDPSRRMAPPQESLHAGYRHRRQIEHGLVDEGELLVLDRALEVGVELERRCDRGQHLWLEDNVAVFPGALGPVHRDVGIPHDLFGWALGACRHADAGGD
jgi:hypothetical protein